MHAGDAAAFDDQAGFGAEQELGAGGGELGVQAFAEFATVADFFAGGVDAADEAMGDGFQTGFEGDAFGGGQRVLLAAHGGLQAHLGFGGALAVGGGLDDEFAVRGVVEIDGGNGCERVEFLAAEAGEGEEFGGVGGGGFGVAGGEKAQQPHPLAGVGGGDEADGAFGAEEVFRQ